VLRLVLKLASADAMEWPGRFSTGWRRRKGTRRLPTHPAHGPGESTS